MSHFRKIQENPPACPFWLKQPRSWLGVGVMGAAFEQQQLMPHACPGRDREDCVRDLPSSWSSAALAAKGSVGHWHNMIKNALDGSEDHLARGPAHDLWHETDMSRMRQQTAHVLVLARTHVCPFI